jgi:hypothetical protein
MRHAGALFRLTSNAATSRGSTEKTVNRNAMLIAILLQASLAASASAQVYQSGYNLGPDYGAMLQQQLQQGERLTQQMQQAESTIVQRAMQNPDCIAKYRQHVAAGGGLSFEQFAYQYAATGGFSAQGMARFRQGEQANQQREHAAWQDYRQAQQQRGDAQAAYAEGYIANQQEAGRVMQGNSSWVDPATGTARALAYIGPDDAVDTNTGQRFHRDESGQYYAQGADGRWYAMAPAR